MILDNGKKCWSSSFRKNAGIYLYLVSIWIELSRTFIFSFQKCFNNQHNYVGFTYHPLLFQWLVYMLSNMYQTIQTTINKIEPKKILTIKPNAIGFRYLQIDFTRSQIKFQNEQLFFHWKRNENTKSMWQIETRRNEKKIMIQPHRSALYKWMWAALSKVCARHAQTVSAMLLLSLCLEYTHSVRFVVRWEELRFAFCFSTIFVDINGIFSSDK